MLVDLAQVVGAGGVVVSEAASRGLQEAPGFTSLAFSRPWLNTGCPGSGAVMAPGSLPGHSTAYPEPQLLGIPVLPCCRAAVNACPRSPHAAWLCWGPGERVEYFLGALPLPGALVCKDTFWKVVRLRPLENVARPTCGC